MTHKVHPLHRTNAMAKVPPTHRVAVLAMETGSPTVAVSTSPAASGAPRATGGQIRNAGESTLTWCPHSRLSDRADVRGTARRVGVPLGQDPHLREQLR